MPGRYVDVTLAWGGEAQVRKADRVLRLVYSSTLLHYIYYFHIIYYIYYYDY